MGTQIHRGRYFAGVKSRLRYPAAAASRGQRICRNHPLS
jgi:hypothetical protein